MNIQFLGAAQTVTGSMHLITVNGSRILLDCGLFQGRRQESHERNKTFPFDAASIDAVILSHAHADHAGNLPSLVRNGYAGPIYATAATRDLCNVMLYDSAYIQERDIEYLNKRLRRRGEPLAEPLYSVEDVRTTMSQMVGISYHKPFQAADGVSGEFWDAGHILGSAALHMTVKEKGKTTNLGFTGDLGRKNMPILKDPELIPPVDLLISESTYGGRKHENVSGTKERLLNVIRRTVDRGGKVIVPSFSLGRTQELVYLLFELFDQGLLPSIPVYVDSPLAINATEVFRMHPECFDSETLHYLHHHEDPFGFGRLTYVRSVGESKKLNEKNESCIIIAASGMCEAGRILHHLANNVGVDRNTVLVVGFQAEHTLGRRIVERQPEIKVFGDIYPLKAEVAIINSLSAHAGQDELAAYADGVVKGKNTPIVLVHGEAAQAAQLQGILAAQGNSNIHVPARLDTIEV